jgi:hypothetical protein
MKPGKRVSMAAGAMMAGSLLIVVLAGTSQPEHQGDPVTDWSLFPKAYGILANEKLMFPMDMSDWPVRIDSSHQLFVDEYLIAVRKNLHRTVHQGRKYAGNPIMRDHQSWEGTGPVFPIVHRDEKTGRFRMWYAGVTDMSLSSGLKLTFPALYAESDDGVHWRRPSLGLYGANNILIPNGNLFGLHIDNAEPDPKRRYKGVVWHVPPNARREGYYLYVSPDGIHWTRETQNPIAISLRGGYTIPQHGIGDTSIFRWDPLLNKYVGDVKFVLPGTIRCRALMESDDLVHWTRPRMTIFADGKDDPDSQIYGNISFCYESMWLGFLRVMHTQRSEGKKQTAVELTASRDGRNWYRVADREEIIPLGAEQDWDTDYHDPAEPVAVGNELWVYYRSGKIRDKADRRYDLGLVKFRRDGFVSLDAASEPGTVLTRPMSFSGRRLFVNAEIGKEGYIKAAVLSYEREELSGYGFGEALGVVQGGVRQPIKWRGAEVMPVVAKGAHLRLAFELKNAQLYSFWIK